MRRLIPLYESPFHATRSTLDNREWGRAMHARVSFYDASTENVDAGIEQFRGVQASVQQMQGNQGGMLLIDREGGKAITITFWDSADDLRATSEQADQLRQQVANTAGLSISSVEGYEVAVQFGP
jgi:heme-degrading monooxygenase HmoA